MARRIDSLNKGDEVELLFHGSKQLGNEPYTLNATFDRIEGTGDKRRSHFLLDGDEPFEAYRYRGGWAYGTSAEKLSLVNPKPVKVSAESLHSFTK